MNYFGLNNFVRFERVFKLFFYLFKFGVFINFQFFLF